MRGCWPSRRFAADATAIADARRRRAALAAAGVAATLTLGACSGTSSAANRTATASSAPASSAARSRAPSSAASTLPNVGGTRRLSVSKPVPAAADPKAPGNPAGSTGGSAAPAQQSRVGPTQRRTFVPTGLTLSVAGRSTPTVQVDAVDTTSVGELDLPKDPGRVGWWKGGALAGEAYGSVVLAGHIDSRSYGMGFFARLLRARTGDTVTLSGGGLQQRYRVAGDRNVAKQALATGTDTFSQSVPARLVLLTCTGHFNTSTHHYDDNLVVTASPVGVVTTAR